MCGGLDGLGIGGEGDALDLDADGLGSAVGHENMNRVLMSVGHKYFFAINLFNRLIHDALPRRRRPRVPHCFRLDIRERLQEPDTRPPKD